MVDLSNGFRAATESVLNRFGLARYLGINVNGCRDYDRIFGYDEEVTVQQYRRMYDRGGIAARVVNCEPKATWRGGVELWEDQDPTVFTEFEKQWDELAKRLALVPTLEAVDTLSGLSNYAVLLIGSRLQGELSTELPKGKSQEDLIYFKQYLGGGGPDYSDTTNASRRTRSWEAVKATIKELDTEPTSVRYGQPLVYQIKGLDAVNASVDVHWSRVIHVAESPLEDTLYAPPRLQNIWNLLTDLMKVRGGGSEAFFQRANQGRIWSIDKEIKDLKDAEKAEFRQQVDDFANDVTRDVRGRGISLETQGSDTADFSSPWDTVVTEIAGTRGIPKRILTGSEMGELASSEDRDNWRDQVNGRRQQYAFPFVLQRLADRLIEYGYLPTPAQYEPKWGAVMNLTEAERQAKASAMANAKTEEGQVFTNAEIRSDCYEKLPLDANQLAAIQKAREDKAKATAMSRPQPVAPVAGAFPRAAQSGDEEIIAILQEAIEGDEREVVDTLIAAAYNPDQPRDEAGRWTGDNGSSKSADKRLNDLIPNRKTKKLTIDVLGTFSQEKLREIHIAYDAAAKRATTNNARMGFNATKKAVEMFLRDAADTEIPRLLEEGL